LRKTDPGDTMATVTRPASTSSDARLDDVSKAIIEQLQEDGRQSYATIAKRVGLSEAAVRQRVQRLLDSGVMQIVAVTDPLQVGFRRQAMIGLRVDGDLTAVGDALTSMTEVDYVVTTAGSFDLLAEVVCEDDDQLLELLTKRIRVLPGVQSTETFVYLKLNKQHYNWGTR
jgi:Lrp/AsnC family transcriptional regulator, regulator for asnA, asnC and gidA